MYGATLKFFPLRNRTIEACKSEKMKRFLGPVQFMHDYALKLQNAKAIAIHKWQRNWLRETALHAKYVKKTPAKIDFHARSNCCLLIIIDGK